MTAFDAQLDALADGLEAVLPEARKRYEHRREAGRDLAPATRARLERCQVALSEILAPATPQASLADRRARVGALADYLAGSPQRLAQLLYAPATDAGSEAEPSSPPGRKPAEAGAVGTLGVRDDGPGTGPQPVAHAPLPDTQRGPQP